MQNVQHACVVYTHTHTYTHMHTSADVEHIKVCGSYGMRYCEHPVFVESAYDTFYKLWNEPLYRYGMRHYSLFT